MVFFGLRERFSTLSIMLGNIFLSQTEFYIENNFFNLVKKKKKEEEDGSGFWKPGDALSSRQGQNSLFVSSFGHARKVTFET